MDMVPLLKESSPTSSPPQFFFLVSADFCSWIRGKCGWFPVYQNVVKGRAVCWAIESVQLASCVLEPLLVTCQFLYPQVA